ncbi:secondary thiamine-phosphate synthase enzyme YjbQ [Candidatus Micrarchaeota archaeon]|nr:secondary thiamine-phosphate synthase enzyme YjbQ [Candidatus Micrarchaeota archaeon]
MDFTVETGKRIEVVDITEEVREKIKGKKGKACLIFAPHATAAITIGEYELNIKEDYEKAYEEIVPKLNYRHNAIDNNAEAHILSALIKPSLVVPMEDGNLVLGTWQSILLIDLDGPRKRRIVVEVLG